MVITLVLPDRFEYVAVAGLASVFLTLWQGNLVYKQRKVAGIRYPQMYAEKEEMTSNSEAYVFNNLQRAHQNTLESYPQFLFCMLATGLKYPTYAATAGGVWVLGRILFTLGYRIDPEKRLTRGGFLVLVGATANNLGATWTVFEIVRERLGF